MRTTVGAGMLAATMLSAQEPAVISSVKPSAVPDGRRLGYTNQGGVYRARSMPVVGLLALGYSIPENRIIGGPDWIRRDNWEIEAKADGERLTVRELARIVLRDRFTLDAAMEKRDRPVYKLKTTDGSGKPGPNLARSTITCPNSNIAEVRKLVEGGVRGVHGEIPCGVQNDRGRVVFGGMSIDTLIRFLPADRVVQDGTGLSGPLDVTLTWEPTDDPVADQAAMFSAMREQLGLRLEPTTALVEVLVVKSANKPAAN